jgi:hypothetical protein
MSNVGFHIDRSQTKAQIEALTLQDQRLCFIASDTNAFYIVTAAGTPIQVFSGTAGDAGIYGGSGDVDPGTVATVLGDFEIQTDNLYNGIRFDYAGRLLELGDYTFQNTHNAVIRLDNSGNGVLSMGNLSLADTIATKIVIDSDADELHLYGGVDIYMHGGVNFDDQNGTDLAHLQGSIGRWRWHLYGAGAQDGGTTARYPVFDASGWVRTRTAAELAAELGATPGYGGIYSGSGTVPVLTTVTLTDTLNFSGGSIFLSSNHPIIGSQFGSGGFKIDSYNTALRENYLELYSTNGPRLTGTVGGDLTFNQGGNPALMTILASGEVGIGTSSLAAKFQVKTTTGESFNYGSAIEVEGEVGNLSGFSGYSVGTTALLDMYRSNGTRSVRTGVLSGEVIGTIRAIGYDDVGLTTVYPSIEFYAAEDLLSTSRGTGIRFKTNPIGAATILNRFEIESLGGINFGAYGIGTFDTDTTAYYPVLTATGQLRERTLATFKTELGIGSGGGIYNGSGTVPTSVTATLTDWINFDGNVGIGTSSPSYPLEIGGVRPIFFNPDGLGGTYGINLKGSIGGWIQFFNNIGSSGTNLGGFGAYGSSDAIIRYFIGTWGNERVSIESGGNVGIGIITPSTALHVYDSSTTAVATIESAGGTSAVSLINSFGTGGMVRSGNSLYFNSNAGTFSFYDIGFDSQLTIWDYAASGSGVLTAHDLTLDDSSSAVQVFLNADGDSYFTGGNVGIGTSSPSTKLSVAGQITSTTSGYSAGLSAGIFGYYTSGPDPSTYVQAPLAGVVEIWKNNTATLARFKDNGQVQFPYYTPAAFSGTSASYPTLDSSGNFIQKTAAQLAGELASSGGGLWSTNANGIHVTDLADRVGIGTTSPDFSLEVANHVTYSRSSIAATSEDDSRWLYMLAPGNIGTIADIIRTSGTSLRFAKETTKGGGSFTSQMILLDNGQLQLVLYTPATFAGTSASYPTFDSSGLFIQKTAAELAGELAASGGGLWSTNFNGIHVTDLADRVGIGTNNPINTLHVAGGQIAVDDDREYRWDNGDVRIQGSSATKYMRFFVNAIETLRISNLNRVGIGDTSPGTKLTVHEDYSSTSQGNDLSVALQLCNINSTANNWTGIGFGVNSSGLGAAAIQAKLLDHTNGYGEFHITTRGAVSGYTTKMMISQEGNVGIGTVSPAQKLRIEGGVSDAFTQYTTTTGTLGSYVGTQSNGEMLISQRENLDLIIKTNNTERIRVENSGNVGIGTNSPTVQIHSLLTTNTDNGIIIQNSNSGNTASSSIYAYSDVGNLFIRAHSSTHSVWANESIMSNTLPGNLNFWQTGAYDFRFWTNGSQRMTIDSTGNVGIGITSPSYKLQLSGGDMNFTADGQFLRMTGARVLEKNGTRLDFGEGLATLYFRPSGNTGINASAPASKLGVGGNMGIGLTYCNVYAAPTNGLIVEGNVGIGTSSPNSTLEVAGSVATAIEIITTTSDTLDETHHVVLVDDDTAGSTVTITLPAASGLEGREYNIKKLGSTANVIVDGNGAETIDGATTATLTTQYESITVVCDGTSWWII